MSRWLIAVLVGLLAKHSKGACPHQESGLTPFSTAYTGLTKLSDVEITGSILLDATLVDVNTITVSGTGKLVFNQGIDITIMTKGIMVKDNASLYIGSEDCPHEDYVNIILQGIRTANRSLVGPEGEKYIAVKDQGIFHCHGSTRLPWTKLAATLERYEVFADDTSNVKYSHKKSSKATYKESKEGPAMYVVSAAAEIVSYEVYDFYNENTPEKEQSEVDKMETALSNVADGQLVAISIQKFWAHSSSSTNVSSLLSTLETVAGMPSGELYLRDMEKFDAFSMMFVKGGEYIQDVDELISKESTSTIVSWTFAGYKLSSTCYVKPNKKLISVIDFRILSLDTGYPVVNVTDDISTWKAGFEIMLTSTDYKSSHAEVRMIKEILTDYSFSLYDEVEYRHFGEIENGVDMRGEVALLTRNIRLEGEMSRGCPASNENCDKIPFDSYGGHFKVLFSFGEVFIEGAELIHMGQPSNKGVYPLHFHMCKDISGKVAKLKHNTIRHTFQRCITIHGTWGTSPESPGVTVEGNVAYDAYGHCYFLEDGAEAFTIFKYNLGAHIKKIDNGFFVTDLEEPAVFWITVPDVYLEGNVAAGGEGSGIWITFPEAAVGPSSGFVYQPGEAFHTPIWHVDNNICHSNIETGFNMEKVIQNEHGEVADHFHYEPLVNPLVEDSGSVKVQISRLTAYKNKERNGWSRGGVEFMQFSGAESKFGLSMARGAESSFGLSMGRATKRQQQFAKNSIFIGISEGNSEPVGYPDAVTPQEMHYFFGIGFIFGPQYVSDCWFTGYKNADDHSYVGGALSFKPRAEFPVSFLTAVLKLRYGDDDATGINRVFVGNDAEEDNGNGNELSSFRDLDGTTYVCDGDTFDGIKQFIKPEKFLLTDNCKCRMTWQMCYCDDYYGSVRNTLKEVWTGTIDDFEAEMQYRRIKYSNTSDIAYENHLATVSEPRALVVLGDDTYYYEVQYVQDFAKSLSIELDGVEPNHDVVVGMCFPENTVKEDFEVKAKSGEDRVLNDEIIWGSSIDAVRADDTMATVFLDGRMLYMHFTNNYTRDPYHDTERCLHGGQCPNFVFTSTGSTARPYTPCFTVTEEMLDTDNMLSSSTLETCTMSKSSAESHWGTGDTQASHDGGWGYWSDWSDCVNGSRTRTRVCDSPTPFGGGQDCSAVDGISDVETGSCT